MSFFLQLNTEEDIQKNVGNQWKPLTSIVILFPYNNNNPLYLYSDFWALKALYIQGGDLINHHQPNGYCQLFGYQYSSKYNICINS